MIQPHLLFWPVVQLVPSFQLMSSFFASAIFSQFIKSATPSNVTATYYLTKDYWTVYVSPLQAYWRLFGATGLRFSSCQMIERPGEALLLELLPNAALPTPQRELC
jgi:hypothetical protein